MGRESRQARRARERREQQRQAQRQRHGGGQLSQGTLAAGIAVVVAVVAIFAFFAAGGTKLASGGPTPTPTVPPPGKTIAGIGCNNMEQATYHVHAHLDIYVDGKLKRFSSFAGHNYDSSCLYWLHTHDTSGMIHIEAPRKIYPTMDVLAKVWGWQLSPTSIWKYQVKPGQSMRVWVNGKPYTGDVRKIVLTRHMDITVEIGPPWVSPKPFNYHGF